MNPRTLIEHHLYFLSTHRGNRESLEEIEFIHSDKPSFNIAFPFSAECIATTGSMFNIYLADWINAGEKTLIGLKKTGSITYMIFSDKEKSWKINNNITAKKAGTKQDIEDFSLVQGKGFDETEEDFKIWYPWMRAKNLANFGNAQQSFYIGYDNEKPVGVCLSIIHNNIMGIYAVATLPEYRKQGISASIMKKAIQDAKKLNVHSVTLQVMTNSYAHKFYTHLGFTDVFHCNIFSHE